MEDKNLITLSDDKYPIQRILLQYESTSLFLKKSLSRDERELEAQKKMALLILNFLLENQLLLFTTQIDIEYQ